MAETRCPALCPGCHNLPAQCTCLPAGATCVDCRHFRRCEFLFQAAPTDKVCDFMPIRFDWADARRALPLSVIHDLKFDEIKEVAHA